MTKNIHAPKTQKEYEDLVAEKIKTTRLREPENMPDYSAKIIELQILENLKEKKLEELIKNANEQQFEMKTFFNNAKTWNELVKYALGFELTDESQKIGGYKKIYKRKMTRRNKKKVNIKKKSYRRRKYTSLRF